MTETNRELLKYCLKNADGWVIENLRNKFNSVLPSDLIICPEDIRIGEKMLSIILKSEVRIRQTEGGYICER